MKKLLLLLIIPVLSFGQLTMIPDSNFEQRLISFGYDDVLDGAVLTAAIDTVTQLEVSYYGISDLTGIEDFVALTELFCIFNNLSNLDIGQNTALIHLDLAGNQLTEIDLNQNTDLVHLDLAGNQLIEIDVSQNTALTYLELGGNQLIEIDVSQNTALTYLHCEYGQLSSLNLNTNTSLNTLHCGGNQLTELNLLNNIQLIALNCSVNNQLNCIQVWDVNYVESNGDFLKDDAATWSLDCNYETSIEETSQKNSLVKTIDLLGRETTNKGFNIEIYDDGSVEKKYLIK